MKRCLACYAEFNAADWDCPACGSRPALRDGILTFAPELALAGGSYAVDFFAELAVREDANFWFRARNRLIIQAVRRWFPHAQRMLELGCGTGYVLRGLQQALPQLELTGSELFSAGLAFARQRLDGVALHQMDGRALPYTAEFDLIGAFDVLEHIADDEAVLREMHRAVRPGGGLLLSVPQHPWLWSAADDHAQHQRRYTRRELVAKVERAGFTVRWASSFVSLVLPLMAASRLRQRLRPADFDPTAELSIGEPLNSLLEQLLNVEVALIAAGVSFPLGGSLFLAAVARSPSRDDLPHSVQPPIHRREDIHLSD